MRWIIVLLFVVLAVILTIQNTQVASLRFLFWEITMSRALLYLLLFVVGFITGWITGSIKKSQRNK